VIASLNGLDDERAWQLRDELVHARAGELCTSYELARAVAKSVTGLDSERAWDLRRRTQKMAPVAALASLLGVSDAESWQWRSDALRQAPKVVMASLRGLHEAHAWRLRDAIMLDCKEALDGLQGVDRDEAWALRERGRDVWPSTVVKSLGTLADSARGRALTQSLLAAYPDNVSLLKHAACIVLGLHRLAREPAE
jgi:dTMP kinase